MKIKTFISIFLLLCTACNKSDLTAPETPQTTKIEIELVTNLNDDYGLSFLMPTGWDEYLSGHFKYDPASKNPVELFSLFFPQMDSKWIFTSYLLATRTINAEKKAVDSIQSNSFMWKTYQHQFVNSDGIQTILDLALHENSEGVYLVGLLTNQDNHENLNQNVFEPVVKSLESVDMKEPDLYSEGVGLFDYDPLDPLNILVQDTVEFESFTQIKFTFASPKGGRVPAVILLPPGSGPFPAIVFMHSMPGTYKNIIGLAETYTNAGAISLLIDAPHGRPENQNRPEGAVTFTNKDYTDQIQLIVDLRRSIDYLLTRPDVDRYKLAYIGASYGGGMGGLLAGVEHRLKAYVLMVGGGGLVSHAIALNDQGDVPQEWITLMWPIEPLHYVGHASPAALLYQSGLKDQTVTIAESVRCQIAGSTPKQIMWYNSDHWLNEQAYQDQKDWLHQFIGIN